MNYKNHINEKKNSTVILGKHMDDSFADQR